MIGRICGPATANIICKGNQRIKLVLLELQIILGNKFVDGVNITLHLLLQQGLRLVFGNTVLGILLQLVIGASGAIAHAVLFVVPERF